MNAPGRIAAKAGPTDQEARRARCVPNRADGEGDQRAAAVRTALVTNGASASTNTHSSRTSLPRWCCPAAIWRASPCTWHAPGHGPEGVYTDNHGQLAEHAAPRPRGAVPFSQADSAGPGQSQF